MGAVFAHIGATSVDPHRLGCIPSLSTSPGGYETFPFHGFFQLCFRSCVILHAPTLPGEDVPRGRQPIHVFHPVPFRTFRGGDSPRPFQPQTWTGSSCSHCVRCGAGGGGTHVVRSPHEVWRRSYGWGGRLHGWQKDIFFSTSGWGGQRRRPHRGLGTEGSQDTSRHAIPLVTTNA